MTARTSAKSRLIWPGRRDQVGDALNALAKDVVGHAEGLADRGAPLDDLQQLLVRDHDERVDLRTELVDAVEGLLHAAPALELEGLGDDADGERADLLLGDLGDDRRGAGPGATALAGGDEDHVGALQRLLDVIAALGRGAAPDLRVRTRAEPLGELMPDRKLDVGLARLQGLDVGVDGDELDAAKAGIDHPADRVRATAAGADDLDDREIRRFHHWLSPLFSR